MPMASRQGFALLAVAATLAIASGCGSDPAAPSTLAQRPAGGAPLPMHHAGTFQVTGYDGYKVVDIRASIISWGVGAKGPEQSARLVLVPKNGEPPDLSGPLAGATMIRTPVDRIAVNLAPFEAMLRELNASDRLVAVGGTKSWDDGIRADVLAGRIAQIGYGWHLPPQLDALLASRPDVLLMSMGDFSHTDQYERIRALGIPVVPIFLDAEPDYMGKVEYIRLVGMLTGREAEADAFVARVRDSVEQLRAAAATQPPRTVISAWFAGNDRWMATVRNADAQLLRDANGINPLVEVDDVRLDMFTRIGTETLLERGRDAECWIARDTHSVPFPNERVMRQFRAYRDGCMFAIDGMTKPHADAFDFYETAVIRPDLVLGDLVRMLHPSLRDEPFRYVRPDTRQP